MSEQKFEYVVVELKSDGKRDRDRRYTEAINDVAGHGWRLVSVQADGHFGAFAAFEREIAE